MADTINELYAKYADGVEQSLVDSKYFQYLFEMVQAGDNTLHQTRRVLHKVVDEEWLKVVEEGIDSIFNIVDKPRRFITTSEEVVPVALARKITADSVRHLSQNTQFITANAKGEILKAEGDAEYMRILSEVYDSADEADFYSFMIAIDSMKKSLTGDDKTIVLDPSSPIAQIFNR